MMAPQDLQGRGCVPLLVALLVTGFSFYGGLIIRRLVFRVCQALRDQQVSQDQRAHL